MTTLGMSVLAEVGGELAPPKTGWSPVLVGVGAFVSLAILLFIVTRLNRDR